jgi:hypothetical protein
MEIQEEFTLAGKIVLSIGVVKTTDITYATACALDELHLRKIDMSDFIFVINVGGYIGDSTKKEIEYAERTGKKVVYLEPLDDKK